jgi:hypothetical protein
MPYKQTSNARLVTSDPVVEMETTKHLQSSTLPRTDAQIRAQCFRRLSSFELLS